jgi:poly-beta-1,6-N-acetyl-D-glucosamine synthase
LLYILTAILCPKNKKKISDGKIYRIEHIVCFKNESDFIEEKLKNCYEISYSDIHHTFVNDHSSDNTLELLKKYKRADTVLMNNESDLGKNQSQMKAVKHTDSDLLLFTDANVFLDKNAVTYLVRHFDENISGVCGDVTVTTDMKHKEISGRYWEIEKRIKHFQSLTGSVIGFDGGFYGIRRADYTLTKKNELSDFESAFLLFEQGKQIRYAEDAFAVEQERRKIKDSFKARIRASNRVIRSFIRIFRYVHKLRASVVTHFLFHKILRYILIITFTLSLPFIIMDMFGISPVLLLILFIPPVFRFIIESVALCIGGIVALTGKEYTTWSNKKF